MLGCHGAGRASCGLVHDRAIVVVVPISINIRKKLSIVISNIASIMCSILECNVVFSIGSCVLMVKPFKIDNIPMTHESIVTD